ncbi:MAG: hypothetical protein IPL12_04930 [Bacteroidetes bacterium]|nr:hypothetical protein [Bacteroidota bacterium]MBK8342720.1 hypothetical protein [Bacteroidota bacterium]
MDINFKQKVVQQPSTVYGIGLIGALIYFIANATSFWMGVLGILKALVWPAFLVYKLFEFLNV